MNNIAPQLSIVIPIFNEELVIAQLRQELEKFRKTLLESTEIILINDGSTDASREMLDQWSNESADVIVKHLSSNFGHQAALLTGLGLARGEYIVTMDADLQDPIGTILPLIQKSQEGFEIVHAQRISRAGESPIRKVSAWMYYRIMKSFVNRHMFLDVADFRLMTKKSLQFYLQRKNRKFIRGEVAQLPFSQTVVKYHREPRIAGESKFSAIKLMKLAMGGFK